MKQLLFLAGLALLLSVIWRATLGLASGRAAAGGPDESAPTAHNVSLVGHIGGASRVIVVQGDRAYVGEGAKMVIYDISNRMAPRRLGQTAPWPGVVEDIAVTGQYAYVVAGPAGLRIVDITDGAAPVERGSVTFGSEPANDVAVSDGYAYVGSRCHFYAVGVTDPYVPAVVSAYASTLGCFGGNEVYGITISGRYAYLGVTMAVEIVDVADPRAPTFVALGAVYGKANEIIVRDACAYVAASKNLGVSSLSILDVSIPTEPILAARNPVDVSRIALAGDRAYLLSGAELIVMDVSDPLAPVHAGVYAIGATGNDLALAGSPSTGSGQVYVYVVGAEGGLHVLNLAGAGAPVERGFFYPPGAAQKVVVSGTLAFVGLASGGVQVVDIADPTAPAGLGAYRPADAKDLKDLALAGRHLYLAIQTQDDAIHLRIVDVADGAAPRAVGAYVSVQSSGYPMALAVTGSHAYLGGRSLEIVDIANPAQPRLAAQAAPWGSDWVVEMATAGGYLYAAVGSFTGGLRVFDIFTPTAPRQVGAYASPSPAHLAVSGRYAYLGSHDTLRILDVTTPATPTLVSEYPAALGEFTVAGNTLYGPPGLRVVDVSDPANPREVGFNDTVVGQGVAVAEGYAYVAAGWHGLRVVDVSRVAPPARATAMAGLPAQGQNVAVAGDRAYVADGIYGLKIVDIADPAAPWPLAALSTSSTVGDVAVAERYAYLVGDSSGLHVVDVADAAAPQEVAVKKDLTGRAIAVRGSMAYLIDGNSLRVVNITHPLSPTQASRFVLSETPTDIAVDDHYAYLPSKGLQVVDVSDPTKPGIAGSAGDWNARGVALSPLTTGRATHAYVAAHADGLRVVDVTDPISPTETSHYAAAGSPRDAVVAGNYAYVMEGHSLRVVSIADPRQPVEVGDLRLSSAIQDMTVSGAFAYVAAGTGGLRVLSLADPARPREVGAYSPAGTDVRDVAVAGAHAYLSVYAQGTASGGVQVVGIADPANPAPLGFYADPASGGGAGPIAAADNYAYFGASSGALSVIYIGDPTTPVKVGSYTYASYVNAISDLAVSGDYAYVIGNGGLHVVDIRNPAKPTRVGRLRTDYMTDLAMSGSRLFIAFMNFGAPFRDQGVMAVDVADPAAPGRVGVFATEALPEGVATAGNRIVIADGYAGVVVVDVADPFVPAQLGRYPRVGDAYHIAGAGTRVYLVDENGLLRMIDVTNGSSPRQMGYYQLWNLNNSGVGATQRGGGMTVVADRVLVASGDAGLYILRYTGPPPLTVRGYLPLIAR